MRIVAVAALAVSAIVAGLTTTPRSTPRPDAIPGQVTRTPAEAEPSGSLACSTSNSAVTPCTGTTTALTNRTKTYTFNVQNKNKFENTDYVLSCSRTSAVASCSVQGTLYVPKNSNANVVVTYVTGGSAGSGTVTLTADDGLTPVSGTVTVTVSAPTPTPLYVVRVDPHLQVHEVDSGAMDTAKFVVRNAGADSTSYAYSVSCSGSAIVGGTCSPTSGTLYLAVGATSTVGVAYTTTGAANAAGAVRVTASRSADATIRDSGTVELAVTRNDSLVQLSQQNQDLTPEQDLCVTISLARGLAAECGDLRAAHGLPGVRTMGVSRAPVLLYH